MKKVFSSDKIYIGQSKISGAGRGVFAARDIKKNEIIETCPIIEVSKNDTANLNESLLNTYFFYFGKNKERLAVALGFGSIYNHSYKPNANFKIKSKEQVIQFIALKNINKDEEITFNYYHGDLKNKKPLWFEKKNWFVYILLCSDNSYYIGSTNDVEKRFKDHIEGRGAKYTKSHKPIKIIYQEKFSTKSQALKREWQLKKLSKSEKEDIINQC